MKYTKEQLEQMSDFEINKALAEKLMPNFHSFYKNSSKNDVCCYRKLDNGEIVSSAIVNYLSNWSDIMPLAMEHDVTYIKDCRAACADLSFDEYGYFFYNESFEHEHPQRAIACCLLMMELN